MVKVIAINGKPGSGKTTFEFMCKQYVYELTDGFNERLEVEIFSSITFVKRIALMCGWDGTKTLKNRKFLSDLKDILTDWNDVPFNKIVEKIKTLEAHPTIKNFVLFVDCREPKELAKLRDELGAVTLLIRRKDDENVETSNHADEDVFEFEYDCEITNDAGLEELKKDACDFMNLILEGFKGV
jgi:hypothetical protein